MNKKALGHPLMRNNILREDLDALIDYLKQDDPRLTQSENVDAFEEEWSNWLGVKHSVFVNSGSSANLISFAILQTMSESGEVIVPPLTWVSDIVAVLHNGFRPVFADIDRRTLSMATIDILDKITDQTRAVFLTHAQGFNGITDLLLRELNQRDIPLIEDVCESHGATFNGRKLGTFGLMSNFSFYYAHHMSTIEGGMISTNSEEIYQMLRMFRGHGLVREASSQKIRKQYQRDYPELNPEFIFAFPGYNVRNTELGAILGRKQLNRLDGNNKIRQRNLSYFLEQLDQSKFRTDYEIDGSCNYAFPLVLQHPDIGMRDRIESSLNRAGIEFRRGSAGGGNQLRQPYLTPLYGEREWENYPETEHIHNFGWYIGNYPDLNIKKLNQICEVLNKCP
jgi:CDP-6-deoxy-D-xylo-4-hexulose-3-dehydrase